jgi:hypothetical protein
MMQENPLNRQFWALKSSGKKPDVRIRIKSEKKFGLEAHSILCVHCGNEITTPEHVITVDGDHIHRFTNPAGVHYQVGCFSSADGCLVQGSPTLEHTWFEGFRWSFSTCSSCLLHLGWYYESKNETFFGLIIDYLVDSSKTL